jgi:hypothetical protein
MVEQVQKPSNPSVCEQSTLCGITSKNTELKISDILTEQIQYATSNLFS